MKNIIFISLLLFIGACSVESNNEGNSTPGDPGDPGTPVNGVKEFINIVVETIRTPQNVFKKGVQTSDESGNSDSFRLPSIITLNDGRVAYAGNVRWASTGEAAHNMETAIRFSSDNGQSWGPMKFMQQFDDFVNSNVIGNTSRNSIASMSVSVSTPVIMQAANGDILVVSSVFPRGSGLFGSTDGNTRINRLNPFVRFEGNLFIKLRPQGTRAVASAASASDATYTMMAPVAGGAVVNRDGSAITGALAGYSIDENWIVRKPDGTPHQGPQYVRGTSRGNLVRVTPEKLVDTHLFYYNSPFHPVGKNYLFLSRSTDGGNTFSYPKDIAHQIIDPSGNSILKSEWFFGTSAGAGYRLREGTYKNRLLVPLQPVATGSGCLLTSIYSDDNGNTWKSGQRVSVNLIDDLDGSTKTAQRLSESQYVEGPENQLFAIHRTGGLSRIAYSISLDGGVTWAAGRLSPLNSVNGGGVIIGAARLYNSEIAGNKALALSFPQSSARNTGVVHIGYFEKSEDDFSGTSTKMYRLKFPGSSEVDNDSNYTAFITPQNANNDFAYSAVTELPNGNIGVAYEYHNTPIPTSGGERTLDFSEIKLNRE